MRVVIDMQGAQLPGSRDRGIGRYTMSLTKSLARVAGEHEIILALNGLLPESVEPIRAAFNELIPQENIRVWCGLPEVNRSLLENHAYHQSLELLREAFLASLQPDIVLISNLLDGMGQGQITSIGRFNGNFPTAVILYDLIPLIHREMYLTNPRFESWYLNKLDHLRRADLLLAISESSRQEAIQHLGFTEQNVVNISTAVDEHFAPLNVPMAREREIRQKYQLYQPFVMYTGGINPRKNIERLILAYAKLPRSIRDAHQLAVVCAIQPDERKRLEELAEQSGLEPRELVLTGFVPERELIELYNLCRVFVFPSLHEGFGLPALEAMACGKAVIGSRISSIPEVIGREDALFNPSSEEEISEKLKQVLSNENFRRELEQHSIEQAENFSWEETARRAVTALEQYKKENPYTIRVTQNRSSRPKLAYISPLPPERSGISDYSAELLPELARYYDIDAIIAQDVVSAPQVSASCNIRSVTWFQNHAHQYDRVLYHFGNSVFHQHMFELLDKIPGTVVLHDFFLSSIVAHMEYHQIKPNGWITELYHSHGYQAVRERCSTQNLADVVWKYPCNFTVLQEARGIIVHSRYALDLARAWYPNLNVQDWTVIPLLRTPRTRTEKAIARQKLGLKTNDFVVCSFGMLGRIKLNHRLLNAWINSRFPSRKNAVLVFVGEKPDDEYGRHLTELVESHGLRDQILITGWVEFETLHQYLSAADVAVQLRTLSRGETSAAVLDCMNYGLPTIINRHGSLADLPEDAVWMLPDDFEDNQLIDALETLWKDDAKRTALSSRAKQVIEIIHNPEACASQYAEAIERFHLMSSSDTRSLIHAISRLEWTNVDQNLLANLSKAIAQTIPPPLRKKQLLVDISELVQRDIKTGIQRVVRNILKEWLSHPPAGWCIEPVYATDTSGYRYARQFTLDFLECPKTSLADEPIEYQPGDIFLGLDLQFQVIPAQRDFYQHLRKNGVRVLFVVYDLLCMTMPQHFIEGAKEGYERWLKVIIESDGAICISKAVADELRGWVIESRKDRARPFEINWFHLGADLEETESTQNMTESETELLSMLNDRPTFLMVGTIEPRKGHRQTLDAFEQLWRDDYDLNLVVVGKQGWLVESLIERLRSHQELNHRLFWLEYVSDELLEKLYATSTCLISASEGEGFGLPLIEAARHKLPIIARDIPVFREVAGDHAFYFSGLDPESLTDAIQRWLELWKAGNAPSSTDMPFLTWPESARRLLSVIKAH